MHEGALDAQPCLAGKSEEEIRTLFFEHVKAKLNERKKGSRPRSHCAVDLFATDTQPKRVERDLERDVSRFACHILRVLIPFESRNPATGGEDDAGEVVDVEDISASKAKGVISFRAVVLNGCLRFSNGWRNCRNVLRSDSSRKSRYLAKMEVQVTAGFSPCLEMVSFVTTCVVMLGRDGPLGGRASHEQMLLSVRRGDGKSRVGEASTRDSTSAVEKVPQTRGAQSHLGFPFCCQAWFAGSSSCCCPSPSACRRDPPCCS
ncbi:hypothetical protein V1508DRAFT_412901 [Lipomyces doorenjongii]|uniref:uncharacterized protein n=1 Tax=Lipomyces doorenjongii TaxID=383834 RepID=UPI0034CE1AA7